MDKNVIRGIGLAVASVGLSALACSVSNSMDVISECQEAKLRQQLIQRHEQQKKQ